MAGLWFSPFVQAEDNAATGTEGNLPSFSHPAGFYTNEFHLEILGSQSDDIVYYTLDGSEPTEQSQVYDGVIAIGDRTPEPNELSRIKTNLPGDQWLDAVGNIFKATVVRARVVSPGQPPGQVVTGTYFVHSEMFSKYTLALVSLATDRENFFDPDSGIYVAGRNDNFNQRGREWERPVHVEFFEPDGRPGFSQNMGARIHGGVSRRMRLKSLRLYARGSYDEENWIRHPVLPGLTRWPASREPLPRLKRLLLRSGGTDWGTDYGGVDDSWGATGMRDPFLQSLARELPLDTQASYRRVLVFLNGEYWGIHNVREVYHTSYFSERYGIDPEEVTVLERNASLDTGHPGDERHFQQMLEYIARHGVRDSVHYEQVKTWMDVDNYIHYLAFQIYIGNFDWPGNNIKFWRKRTSQYEPDAPYGHDGRWRWLVYDTDLAAGSRGWSYTHNTLEHASLPSGGHSLYNPPWSTFLFRSLLENQEFRGRFINQLADHLNSSFKEKRVLERLEEMRLEISPELLEHIMRWRTFNGSSRRWVANVNGLADFAGNRPRTVRQHVLNKFQLSGLANVSVSASNPHGGRIRINNLKIADESLPWDGTYFTGVPVEIEAVPYPGFRFAGWDGDTGDDSPVLALSLTEDVNLVASFEVDDPAQFPVPFDLSSGDYRLERWDADQPPGMYPANMAFRHSQTKDPGLDAAMDSVWDRAYNLENRSRIHGLGGDGFSFLNTANAQDAGAGYLGTADLSVSTAGHERVWVSWRGSTVRPNSRPYAVRFQYRVGQQGAFEDVFWEGEPVDYVRNESAGHSQAFGPLLLPPDTAEQPVVHLRWRYYAIPSDVTGPRAELGVRDIWVTAHEPAPASRVALSGVQPAAQSGRAVPLFYIHALRADGSLDTAYGGEVALHITDAPGNPIETITRPAESGAAAFGDVVFQETGSYRMTASAAGLEPSVPAAVLVGELSARIVPAYIQGGLGEANMDRVPFAFKMSLSGLQPNATYRYANRMVTGAEGPNSGGAGNMIHVPANETSFRRSTATPDFSIPGTYGELTTDAAGEFTGWFITEPTGNWRFEPGMILFPRLLLNDGFGGGGTFHYLTGSEEIAVLRFGTNGWDATAVYGQMSGGEKNLVVLYGEGSRPLAATLIEDDGQPVDERYAEFYQTEVDGRAGFWGALIPNALPGGVRRIEQYSTGGLLLNLFLSADGVWPGEMTTVNPSGGTDALGPIIPDKAADPYTAWLLRFFEDDDLLEPAITGLDADPDRDGISNRVEYALGLNPTLSDRTGLPAPSIIVVEGKAYLAITYTRNLEASGVEFVTLVSSDLQSWSNDIERVHLVDSGTVQTVVERDKRPLADSVQRFIRVDVRMENR